MTTEHLTTHADRVAQALDDMAADSDGWARGEWAEESIAERVAERCSEAAAVIRRLQAALVAVRDVYAQTPRQALHKATGIASDALTTETP